MTVHALKWAVGPLALFAALAATAAPELSLTGPGTVHAGSAVTLKLRLAGGTEPYSGFNARIGLPKGVVVTGVARGALLPSGFQLDYRVSETDTSVWLAVVGYSSTSNIAGTDGALLDIGLQVTAGAAAATHSIGFATTNADPAINSMHALSDVHGATSVNHTVAGMRLTIAAPLDTDGDGIPDATDNCPTVANKDQADLDADKIGDACDPDIDGDGYPNGVDAFPRDKTDWLDTDGDGIGNNADPDDDNDGVLDGVDNCPLVANPDQADQDRDGIGDACDPDNRSFCWECLPSRGGWRSIIR